MSIEGEVIELMKKPEPRKRIGIIKTQIVREGSLLYGSPRLQNPQDAAELVRGLFQYADREMMIVLSLDSKNAPVALEIVSVGTVNACLVQMREVFKHAILSNATFIMCFHNHPSEIPDASQEDINITKRMEDAGKLLGIELLDHIIIGDGMNYVSLREKGIITGSCNVSGH